MAESDIYAKIENYYVQNKPIAKLMLWLESKGKLKHYSRKDICEMLNIRNTKYIREAWEYDFLRFRKIIHESRLAFWCAKSAMDLYVSPRICERAVDRIRRSDVTSYDIVTFGPGYIKEQYGVSDVEISIFKEAFWRGRADIYEEARTQTKAFA